MSASSKIAEDARERRALRAEIGRHRRLINARVAGVRREAKELTSWRTYVGRYPLAALGGAFGVGWAVSAGLPRAGWASSIAKFAARQAFAGVPGMLAQSLTDIALSALRDRAR